MLEASISSNVLAECDDKLPPTDMQTIDAESRFIHVGDVQLPPDELPEFDEEFYVWKRNYWKHKLAADGIRFVVAPMVDQSELAFRMMMLQHGAQLVYTPMIHAFLFSTNPTYRRTALATLPEDRPLIVQFCANSPEHFLNACRYVEGVCEGVDLNLGCPQQVARRGHYGSYLQEEPELIADMVAKVYRHCRLPLSVKIRVFDDVHDTINYARIIAAAGASMLTVHGRTREQRGVTAGRADWSRIRAVVEAVDIPVIANGNIQMPGDAERCLSVIGAAAVMSAEGLLNNPALFDGRVRINWEIAREYLDYAERYDAPLCAIRAHMFRMCHYSLQVFADLREQVASSRSVCEYRAVTDALELRCAPLVTMRDGLEYLDGTEEDLIAQVRKMPHWFAKPYIRPAQIADVEQRAAQAAYRAERHAHIDRLKAETGLSARKIRRRERRNLTLIKTRGRLDVVLCVKCAQPAGVNCENESCRRCCRTTCVRSDRSCATHRLK